MIRHRLGVVPPQIYPKGVARSSGNYVDVAKGPIVSPCEFVD